MPNWVTNVLTVEGDERSLAEFREFVKGGEWEIEGDIPLSFFKIHPYPGGEMTDEEYKRAGSDWCWKNWGAMGPYRCEITHEGPTQVVYRFETAWDAPIPIIQRLAEHIFQQLNFSLHAEEPNMDALMRFYKVGSEYKYDYGSLQDFYIQQLEENYPGWCIAKEGECFDDVHKAMAFCEYQGIPYQCPGPIDAFAVPTEKDKMAIKLACM